MNGSKNKIANKWKKTPVNRNNERKENPHKTNVNVANKDLKQELDVNHLFDVVRQIFQF